MTTRKKRKLLTTEQIEVMLENGCISVVDLIKDDRDPEDPEPPHYDNCIDCVCVKSDKWKV